MASDGCQTPAWYSQGMLGQSGCHLPGMGTRPSENYGMQRVPGHGSSGHVYRSANYGHYGTSGHAPTKSSAKTGTWDGPAPKGYLPPGQAFHVDKPEMAAAKLAEKRDAPIPGGGRMPLVCLRAGPESTADEVSAALTAGYKAVDTEAASEVAVGEALGRAGAPPRAELFLIGKLPNDAHRPEAVQAACERTLAALGTDCLDLYLIHWPTAWVAGSAASPQVDEGVTLEETWAAMEALVEQGKAKAIGVANFSVHKVDQLNKCAKIKPSVNQVELHPMLAQRKLVGVCRRYGVTVQAHTPLGHGKLPELTGHKAVAEAAAAAGKTPAQILLRWSIHRGVPLVVKCGSAAKAAEHADVFDWELRPEDKRAIDDLDCGKRVVDPEADGSFPGFSWDPAELGGAGKASVELLGLPR